MGSEESSKGPQATRLQRDEEQVAEAVSHCRSRGSLLAMQRLDINAETLALFVSARKLCIFRTTGSAAASTALMYSSDDFA